MAGAANPGEPVWAADFDYDLPPDRIAQTPIEPRDASRLLVLHRDSHRIEHRSFRDIGDVLSPGDLLVLNNSRVIAARLTGRRVPSGGAVEALLIHERGLGDWEVLLKPGKRIHPGDVLSFRQSSAVPAGETAVEVQARIQEWLEDGLCLLRFESGSHPEQLGATPLPPYIHEQLADGERYQTVYAREPGSAAAPTAGLHFTPELLDELRRRGIGTAFVTLHVGPATFRPVHVLDAREHPMHAEYFFLNAETAATIEGARREHRRIIAVGTTSVRVLEQIGGDIGDGPVEAAEGWTRLLILPGYRYRLVNALITNFHLPRSTLLMLVAALTGRDLMFETYAEAIRRGYRFYSFGDAMLIL
jgi:S-adenosylmethionine:tRNA ribosyltransferase-isomerase